MEIMSSTLSLVATLLKSGRLFATLPSTLSSLVFFRGDEGDDTGDRSYLKKFPLLELVTPKSMILGH